MSCNNWNKLLLLSDQKKYKSEKAIAEELNRKNQHNMKSCLRCRVYLVLTCDSNKRNIKKNNGDIYPLRSMLFVAYKRIQLVMCKWDRRKPYISSRMCWANILSICLPGLTPSCPYNWRLWKTIIFGDRLLNK